MRRKGKRREKVVRHFISCSTSTSFSHAFDFLLKMTRTRPRDPNDRVIRSNVRERQTHSARLSFPLLFAVCVSQARAATASANSCSKRASIRNPSLAHTHTHTHSVLHPSCLLACLPDTQAAARVALPRHKEQQQTQHEKRGKEKREMDFLASLWFTASVLLTRLSSSPSASRLHCFDCSDSTQSLLVCPRSATATVVWRKQRE